MHRYSLQPSSSLPSGQSTVPSHLAFCFLKQISLPHLKVLLLHGIPKNEQKKTGFFLAKIRFESMTLNSAKDGLGTPLGHDLAAILFSKENFEQKIITVLSPLILVRKMDRLWIIAHLFTTLAACVSAGAGKNTVSHHSF